MVTHRNVMWTAASADQALAYPTGLRAVSYLPLAHIAERLATHYLGMHKRAHVHFCPEVLRVFEIVPKVRPQAFLGVPRVWEKVQAGVMAKLAEEPNPRKRSIALKAIQVGRKAALIEGEGKAVPLGLRLQRGLFDRLVYAKIRHGIGLDQSQVQATAAAPISRDTLEFLQVLTDDLVFRLYIGHASVDTGSQMLELGVRAATTVGIQVALERSTHVS